MSDLQDFIESAKKKNTELKDSFFSSNKEFIIVHDIPFHPSVSLNILEDKKISLGHTLLHQFNGESNPRIPKSWIRSLHSLFVEELHKRGKHHYIFDKLD